MRVTRMNEPAPRRVAVALVVDWAHWSAHVPAAVVNTVAFSSA
jgi:hypothetical protein